MCNFRSDNSEPRQSGPKQSLAEVELESDKREIIHREIDKFREIMKKREAEKEEEKKNRDRDRDGDRHRDRSRDYRDRDRERDRHRGRDRDRERERERDRGSSKYHHNFQITLYSRTDLNDSQSHECPLFSEESRGTRPQIGKAGSHPSSR